MVELLRSFRREPLGRPPGSSTLVGVPALPRVPDDSGLIAQAGATFARGLYALSDAATAIAERDRKLKQAEEVAQGAKAVGEFHLSMSTVPQQMQEDNVPALQRPEYLKTFGQGHIDLLAQHLPPRVQTQFRAQATQDLARMVLQEQSRASQLFVDEQREGFPAVLSLVGRQLVTADERQRPTIEASLTAIATSYVAAGILSAPVAQQTVQKVVDEAAIRRVQLAIAADPQAMQQQLQAQAAGRAVNPALPTAPPAALPALVDQANGQLQQQLQWADAAARRADKAVQETQNHVYVELRGTLMGLDPVAANTDKFRSGLADAEQKYKDGKISVEHYNNLTTLGRSMLDRSLAPNPAQDNVTLERDLTVQLAQARNADEVAVVRQALLARATELRPETISRLNTQIEMRLDQSHYSNTKEYRDGVDIILRAAIVPGQFAVNIGSMQEETKRKLQLALDAYEQQMSTLGRQNINDMKAQARPLAYSLRDAFLPLAPEALPPMLQELKTEEDLRKRLNELKGLGVPDSMLQQFRDLWRMHDTQRQETERRKSEQRKEKIRRGRQ